MFEFQYTLNDKDFLEFNYYHMLHSPVFKKQKVVLRALLPAMLIILLIFIFISEKDIGAVFLIICILVSLLWLIFFKKIMYFSVRRSIGATKKAGKLPYGKNAKICFRDEDIFDISDDTELKIKYKKIENIAIAEHAVYIYIGAVEALILPLSLFADQNSVNAFVGFLEEKRRQAG